MRVAVVAMLVCGLAACGSSASSSSKTATKPPATSGTSGGVTTTAPSAAGCEVPTPAQHGNGKQYSSAPAMTIDPAKTYTATVLTTCGTFTVALDAKHAPKGVNNFVFLARQGFYDGLKWHRVVPNFVIQGGDPVGDGTGGPGYEVVTETPSKGYFQGDLAWAKTAVQPPGTAGSQFFVVTGDPSPLDATKRVSGTKTTYDYGEFGHITSGYAVAKRIESFAPPSGDGAPTTPMYIVKVTITEK
jgi:cyclophilin family peptidyl-prolyl cis-trans isomerase